MKSKPTPKFYLKASISLENFRLMGEALENECYKEELNIAKQVQRALLLKSVKKTPMQDDLLIFVAGKWPEKSANFFKT